MKAWWKALDGVLRGEMTKGGNLQQGLAAIPVGGMTVLFILLGIVYGGGKGTFALFKEGGPSFAQFLAATLKIPLLFLLTLLITFPSLYVFNTLVGSALGLLPVLRLLLAALGVTMAVAASFGPIVAFFSISTTSYSFMVLLNVLMCTVAGILGLSFLRQTLQRLSHAQAQADLAPPTTVLPSASVGEVEAPAASPAGPAAGAALPSTPPPLPTRPKIARTGALDAMDDRPLGKHVQAVFRCWMVLFALVGSQMAWVMRPFIGNPNAPFVLFRGRQSNFFAGVWDHVVNLFQ